MLSNKVKPLPVRVRPAPFETLESFERRLREANGYRIYGWTTVVNGILRAQRSPDRESLLETLGSLQLGHFERDRRRANAQADEEVRAALLSGRFDCKLCARGETVPQIPHDGPRVCRRHLRWIGPGVVPEGQVSVDAGTLRADRRYQRLRQAGQLDAFSFAEVLACVDAWADTSGRAVASSLKFQVAVALAPSLPKIRPESDLEGAHEALEQTVESVVICRNSNVLVDALWTLLRANYYATLDVGADGKMVGHSTSWNGLSSSFYPRMRHLQLTQMVRSKRNHDRFAHADRLDWDSEYVCAMGHPFRSNGRRIAGSKASAGCGFCGRKRPTFETSLASTHPHLAAEWAPENGKVRPEDVFAGSRKPRYWRCGAGHAYLLTPNARMGGINCGFCSNRRVDETNSLRTTHPDIASELNDALNKGRTADNVVAGSARKMAWTCPSQHDYWSTPEARTRGANCPICTHNLVHTTKCLAASNPEVAALWHESLNGETTPCDVFPLSTRKAWWRCENGCVYEGTIAARVKGSRCRFCAGRAVDRSNCMRVRRPDLAAEFDTEKNQRTPDNLAAGTRRALWWRCRPHGHEWRATGATRVANNSGCPVCVNKKVKIGVNDMATTRPDLAAELHGSRNGEITSRDVVAGTSKSLWWQCRQCKGEWKATGDSRANKGRGCRRCRRMR